MGTEDRVVNNQMLLHASKLKAALCLMSQGATVEDADFEHLINSADYLLLMAFTPRFLDAQTFTVAKIKSQMEAADA